ncbi:unnamed protein product, partial [Iphiclides podalirius]
MKFRAVMIDAGPMREFSMSDDTSGPSPPILWCEIPQAMFFSEYQLIGVDDEHKDIYLGFISANLARPLLTLKSAKSLKMKLTKKQCPCLTLEIEMPSSMSQQTRQVTHDIPVTVVPRKNWSDYHEPQVPKPDISIELPSLKQLRNTIDRMRTMASDVVIRASAEGRLTLQIKTDMAKVSTRFKGLRVDTFEGPIDHSDSETESQINEDLSQVCSCRVDAKKLSMFLSADQISHNRIICCIVHKRLVILCLQTDENVQLQCFITGIVY